jgi:hypothetical protein
MSGSDSGVRGRFPWGYNGQQAPQGAPDRRPVGAPQQRHSINAPDCRPDYVAPKPYELGPNPAPHNDRHQSVASRPEPASWREGRAARSRGASRASWHQPGRSARSRARDPPVGMDSSYSRCPSNGGIPSPTSVLPVAGAQRIPPGRQKVLGGAVMAHRQRVCQPVAQRTAGAVEGAVLPCTPRAPTRWAASAPVQPVTTTTLSCKIWPSC